MAPTGRARQPTRCLNSAVPHPATPAAIGSRRRADRVGDTRFRSPPGLAGGRRIAGHQRRAHEPCVARHRRRGGEPEGSDLPVAQGSRRRPQFYPDRVRPRLPLHCRGSFDLRLGCLSGPEATKAPAQSKDCSPTGLFGGRRPVHPEVTLAGILILPHRGRHVLAVFGSAQPREKGEDPWKYAPFQRS